MAGGKLTPKQKRFVEEYLISLNATNAARIAGFKQPQVQCARLLANVRIQQKINQAVKQRSKRTEITQDRVLTELGRIAFFDPRRLFDEHGNFKDVKDLDEDIAACISGIEIVRDKVKNDEGEITTTETIKLKFWNKVSANHLGGKHLKMFKETVDVNVFSHEETLKDLE